MSPDVKIYVITHKKYDMLNNELYFPLFAGAKEKESFGYLRDDEGDNISYKNPNYSELTGLYWIWKNSNEKIIGLCHYRRYFIDGMFGNVLNNNTILTYLKDYDLIIPKKVYYRSSSVLKVFDKYYISKKDIYLAKEVIHDLFPDYDDAFEKFFNGKYIYPLCMFVAKKELMDSYCEWLFKIFEVLEDKIDYSSYTGNRLRVYAYLGELLFNVWIEYNKLKVKETYIKHLEVKSNLLVMFFQKFPLLRF